MRNIKLTLEYDGARFFGFQRQPGKRTVQSELGKAFRQIFRTRIKIGSAAGRTDAGVHAKGQVVHFKVDSVIPLANIRRAFNTYLPEDLAVVKCEAVSLDFHARFWAKSKTYEYVVFNSRIRSPLIRHRSYHFPHPLNLSLMQRAAGLLIGRHDFRSFQAKAGGRNSIRTVRRLNISRKGSKVLFLIEGDGFLYNMVRAVVGTLLLVGTGRINLARFRKIIKSKNRSHVGPTLPPRGLTLLEVNY